MRRRELESDRSVLIVGGSLSPPLRIVLRDIFSCYAANGSLVDIASLRLTKIEASRLWYRCGMKLSSLYEILEQKERVETIVFEDFCSLLQRIVDDDAKHASKMALNHADGTDFEVRISISLYVCVASVCCCGTRKLTCSPSIDWREGGTY